MVCSSSNLKEMDESNLIFVWHQGTHTAKLQGTARTVREWRSNNLVWDGFLVWVITITLINLIIYCKKNLIETITNKSRGWTILQQPPNFSHPGYMLTSSSWLHAGLFWCDFHGRYYQTSKARIYERETKPAWWFQTIWKISNWMISAGNGKRTKIKPAPRHPWLFQNPTNSLLFDLEIYSNWHSK